MIESVGQVHTDGVGNNDKSRGGAGGKSKQRRAFLEAMHTLGQAQFDYTYLIHISAKKLSQHIPESQSKESDDSTVEFQRPLLKMIK